MQTVIGIDYGTQSARAILVDTASGDVLRSRVVRSPHGHMSGDLASVQDYQSALDELLLAVTPEEYRETVAGICVDATSFAMVPIGKDGCVFAQNPALRKRKHAQMKLWKYHAAQKQMDAAHRAEYEALYRRNHALREMTIQSSMRLR